MVMFSVIVIVGVICVGIFLKFFTDTYRKVAYLESRGYRFSSDDNGFIIYKKNGIKRILLIDTINRLSVKDLRYIIENE